MNHLPYFNVGRTKRVEYASWNLNSLNLTDFALSLSHISRYMGHTSRPYSVLEHLVLCENILLDRTSLFDPRAISRLALAVLVHDMHEALVTDMPSTHKRQISDWAPFEKRAEDAVAEYLGFDYRVFHEQVRWVDLVALQTERLHFGLEADVPDDQADWPSRIAYAPSRFGYSNLEANDKKATADYLGFIAKLRADWIARVLQSQKEIGI